MFTVIVYELFRIVSPVAEFAMSRMAGGCPAAVGRDLSLLLLQGDSSVTVAPLATSPVPAPGSKQNCYPALPSLPEEHQLFLPLHQAKKALEAVAQELVALMTRLQPGTLLEVGQLATQLQAEPSRVSFSCNVLEAVQLVSKTSPTSYTWHGRVHLVPSLVWLRHLADQERVLEQLYMSSLPSQEGELKAASEPREKLMVGVLAQKLLMVSLVSPEGSLDVSLACRVIHGPREDKLRARLTQVREVCAVLASAGLLKGGSLKTPLIQYVGPEVGGESLTQEEASRLPGGGGAVRQVVDTRQGQEELDRALGHIV